MWEVIRGFAAGCYVEDPFGVRLVGRHAADHFRMRRWAIWLLLMLWGIALAAQEHWVLEVLVCRGPPHLGGEVCSGRPVPVLLHKPVERLRGFKTSELASHCCLVLPPV